MLEPTIDNCLGEDARQRVNAMGTLMLTYMQRIPQVSEEYLSAELDKPSLQLVDILRSGTPVVLTGCGTSYHMALNGARYFATVAGIDAWAVTSFDLERYSFPAASGKLLLAISHSGTTKATLDAVEKVRNSVAKVVAISAREDTKLARSADIAIVLPGGWEEAYPKTMTYTCGSLQLLRIACATASCEPARKILPDAPTVGTWLQESFDRNKDVVKEAAAAWKDRDVFTFVGGGPGWVAALEIALKMRENNYTASEGIEVEEIAHGRMAAVNRTRPLVCIALPSCADRAADIVNAARHLGAPTMVVADENLAGEFSADFVLTVPATSSELLTAILAVSPLQYFSHQLSLAKGINPDSIRTDDPVFAFAQSKWIFPSGTH